MWMRLPPELAIQSALFVAWYIIAFVLLFRLPWQERRATTAVPAWKPAVLFPVLVVGAWYSAMALQAGAMFVAYGFGLAVAAVCTLVVWHDDAALSDVPIGALAAWLLGFAALLIRLSAPDTAPPGLAEDEAKKCVDCLEVLGGGSVFKIGSLSHPNFPCLVIGPLLAAFGPSTFVAHVYSVVAGSLSVVAFFVLASMLLSPPTAVAATALLVASPNHLLYSRVLFGTEITLPQILFLAFTIDAARRLSWVSALMAGSALGILLHHYVVVRALPMALVAIFVIAQVAERQRWLRRAAVLGAVLLTTAMTLAPLLSRPDGRVFLLKPVQYSQFAFSNLRSAADFGERLQKIVHGHLRLFHRIAGGTGTSAAMAHSRAAMLPILLELLLIFGFADAVVRWTHFNTAVMATLFVVGLVPSILSGLPNNHRSMLVTPVLYLLIGNVLDRLAVLWPRGRVARALGSIALAVLVLVGAVQSLQFYFGDAWTELYDQAAFGANCAGIANEVQQLTVRGRAQITGGSEEIGFLAYDQVRDGRLRRFSYAEWLPENWKPEQVNLIMDSHWADLRWQLHDMVAPSQVRTLTDQMGRVVGASVVIGVYDLHRSPTPPDTVQCGVVMFNVPRQVVSVQSGALQIDGMDVQGLPVAAQPWFAAGLHPACVSALAVFTVVDPKGTSELARLTPAELYDVPIQGWLHRIECENNPGAVTYLGIEPFLYHFGDGVPTRPLCARSAQHTWSAMLAPHPTGQPFQIYPYPAGLQLELNGEPLPLTVRFGVSTFLVPPSTEPQRLDLKLEGIGVGNEGIQMILYVPLGGQPQIPRFDLFSPPPHETALPASAMAWASLPEGKVERAPSGS